MEIPRNIDQLDWNQLAAEMRRVHALNPSQRENYFDNVLAELPKSSESYGNALFSLVPVAYCMRQIHNMAGLDYSDPYNENGQIIRVAMMALLEDKFLRGQEILAQAA